ncbi:unnamed protein product [Cyprideis torosa]|uniref:Ubiquitin-conjugating enzyme E2 T n=1 Tax=Cyprideis torosa TaxID=163714 RepID=A0A7R8WAQ9_9CRUS|nr:unnamed protein product [Cyprideis torosa]CAG0885559.1 unnamed protein product [Cyprideis torosa]
MASHGIRHMRLKKEIAMLSENPPPGIACHPVEADSVDSFDAQIVGPDDTPYAGGFFHLRINVPAKYPFEPPDVIFQTKIYHPNIDEGGRICLDILRGPPNGAWKPSLNLSTLLQSVSLLLSNPHPQDPLVADIANELMTNPSKFNEKAKRCTELHAMSAMTSSTSYKGEKRSLESEHAEGTSKKLTEGTSKKLKETE